MRSLTSAPHLSVCAALFFTSANCDNPVTSLNSLQNLLVPPPLMRQEVRENRMGMRAAVACCCSSAVFPSCAWMLPVLHTIYPFLQKLPDTANNAQIFHQIKHCARKEKRRKGKPHRLWKHSKPIKVIPGACSNVGTRVNFQPFLAYPAALIPVMPSGLLHAQVLHGGEDTEIWSKVLCETPDLGG
eukprot:scaffold34625_cov19-Tisochrysis_lutea.AAC.1